MSTSAAGLWDPPRQGRSLLEVVGSGTTGSAALPDDKPAAPGTTPWAPGALAGVMARDAPTVEGRPGHPAADAAVAVLERHVRNTLDRDGLLGLYDSLAEDDGQVQSVLGQAVAVWVKSVAAREPTTVPATFRAVREVSGWLLLSGTERGPVRSGINLASMLSDLGGHAVSIATLGRHVEQSLEASQALGRERPAFERSCCSRWPPGTAAGVASTPSTSCRGAPTRTFAGG